MYITFTSFPFLEQTKSKEPCRLCVITVGEAKTEDDRPSKTEKKTHEPTFKEGSTHWLSIILEFNQIIANQKNSKPLPLSVLAILSSQAIGTADSIDNIDNHWTDTNTKE